MGRASVMWYGRVLCLSACVAAAACAPSERPEPDPTGVWETVATIRGDEHGLATVSDVAVLPTGELAIADAGEHRIAWFDSTGSLVRRVGRQGRGPGEFQMLNSLAVSDRGTLLAYDTRLRRLTEFGTHGELLHTHGAGVAFGWKLIAEAGGELLFVTETLPGPRLRAQGFGADSGKLVAVHIETGEIRVVASVPVRTRLAVGDGAASMVISTPFDSPLIVALCGSDLLTAFGDDNAVRWLRVDGSPATNPLLTHGLPRPEMTEPVLRAALDRRAGNQRGSDLAMRAGTELEKHRNELRRPYFDAAAIDVDGSVWLRTGPTTWRHYADDGQTIGTVELPSESRIVSMNAERVVARRDRDDGTDIILMKRSPVASRRCANQWGATRTVSVEVSF